MGPHSEQYSTKYNIILFGRQDSLIPSFYRKHKHIQVIGLQMCLLHFYILLSFRLFYYICTVRFMKNLELCMILKYIQDTKNNEYLSGLLRWYNTTPTLEVNWISIESWWGKSFIPSPMWDVYLDLYINMWIDCIQPCFGYRSAIMSLFYSAF